MKQIEQARYCNAALRYAIKYFILPSQVEYKGLVYLNGKIKYKRAGRRYALQGCGWSLICQRLI